MRPAVLMVMQFFFVIEELLMVITGFFPVPLGRKTGLKFAEKVMSG